MRAEEITGANRITREIEGVAYTFSPADEPLVRELAPRIAAMRQKQNQIGAHESAEERRPFTAQDLRENKSEYLRQIASSLGLEAPAAEQVQSYDVFLELFEKFAAVGDRARKEVRNCPVAVWRKPELVAVLKRGERVPGFKLAPDGEMVEFSWHYAEQGSTETPVDDHAESNTRYGYNLVAGGGSETRSAYVTLNAVDSKDEKETAEPGEQANVPASLPIVVKSGETPDELLRIVEGLLENLQSFGVTSLSDAFVLLHEAVEVGVVQHYIVSADRRWLCDGVANYVAWRIIRDRAGAPAAREAYDLATQLEQGEPQRKKVNLRRWKAAEEQNEPERESPLNRAHYAFATRAVFLMVEQHGEDFLPRLFREIGKTPRDKTTMRTVEKAYRKLTGENLSHILKAAIAPPSKKERLPGVAQASGPWIDGRHCFFARESEACYIHDGQEARASLAPRLNANFPLS